MPKKYRVISQAAAIPGKTRQDVYKALLKMNMKPEQVQLLLTKPLVIKKGLDNPQALEYAERFSAAGLKVRLEAYEVAPPPEVTELGMQKDAVYAQLLKTFGSAVEPTQLSQEYSRSLVRVVVAALAAPLIYGGIVLLALAVLIGYFGYLHGALFDGFEWRGRVMWALWILTYLLPLVVCGVLLAFLLFPLWPRAKPPRRPRLDPKQHARFHHLINQMTAAMDVPAPEFIEITPDANAAAGPVHGILSLLRGELRLVLGMGLVAGTSVQALMGILAHEFGHFSQRKTMIANIWVNTINGWLADCAYGQDEWDERFERWGTAYDYPVVHISLAAAAAMVGGMRKLFARLCDLNIRITHAMSRQMEFDADLYEARVAGSRNFRSTTLSLRKLAYAAAEVNFLNQLALHQRDQLLRNVPAALVEVAGALGAETLRRIEGDLQREETRYWDTHPADLERIAHAERAKDPGLVDCALPARVLFDNFDALCETATLGYYLGEGIHGAGQFQVDNRTILDAKAALVAQHRLETINNADRAAVNADGSIDWTVKEP